MYMFIHIHVILLFVCLFVYSFLYYMYRECMIIVEAWSA